MESNMTSHALPVMQRSSSTDSVNSLKDFKLMALETTPNRETNVSEFSKLARELSKHLSDDDKKFVLVDLSEKLEDDDVMKQPFIYSMKAAKTHFKQNLSLYLINILECAERTDLLPLVVDYQESLSSSEEFALPVQQREDGRRHSLRRGGAHKRRPATSRDSARPQKAELAVPPRDLTSVEITGAGQPRDVSQQLQNATSSAPPSPPTETFNVEIVGKGVQSDTMSESSSEAGGGTTAAAAPTQERSKDEPAQTQKQEEKKPEIEAKKEVQGNNVDKKEAQASSVEPEVSKEQKKSRNLFQRLREFKKSGKRK